MAKYDPNKFSGAERGWKKADCIERGALLQALPVDNYYTQTIRAFPAADVRPVAEVNAAVDEALRILNALNGTGQLEYGDYCEMFDAIEAIKSVDKQEVRQK